MSNKLASIFYLSFLIIIASACSVNRNVKKEDGNKDLTTIDRSASEVSSTTSLLEARKMLLAGEGTLALKNLYKAIDENPQNDAAYYELSRIYQFSGTEKEYKKAIEFGQKAIDLDPNNVWYYKNMIGIYKRKKEFNQAAKVSETLVKRFPNTKEHYYQLANMYIFAEDYKSALFTYDRLEKRFGFEEGVILQKKQIYLKLGNYNKALKEINKLIEYSPTTKKYYGMAADIYLEQREFDKAYTMFQKILELDPNDGRVHLALADYYRLQGNEKMYFFEIKTAMGNPSLDMDTKIKVLIKHLQNTEGGSAVTAQAYELIDTVLVASPKDPKALAMKADFLNRDGKYKEAIEYFRLVIAEDSSRYLVWEQMLLVEKRLGDYPALANESGRALRIFPQQPSLYFFSGMANIEIKNYSKAEEHLKMGLNFVFENKAKSDFYGLLAKAEFRQHKFGPADDHFSRAIVDNPLNAQALKDYAYFLAYNNKDLEKAEQLATAALEITPNDPDYIYTYAFVLFKSDKIDLSKKWIADGLKKYPNHKDLQLLNQEVNKNE